MPGEILSSRGFTLVELLVALSILAIVAGLLSNSMRFGLGAAGAVESRMAAVASLYQSERAFRRQVQLARPILLRDSESGEEVDFVAKSKRLEFIAPLPGLATGGGLYRIALRIEDDPDINGDSGRLIMNYRMYLDGADDRSDGGDAREVVFLQGFSNARFSFGDILRRENGKWTDEWRHRERLPDIVRLSISTAESAHGAVPDFIVAIKGPLPQRPGAS